MKKNFKVLSFFLNIILLIFLILFFSCQQQSSSNGHSGGGGNQKRVSIDPKEVTLPPDGLQLFKAAVTGISNTEVNWEVLEGINGGTITQQGEYTAPNNVGDFHVVVTSISDPSKKDTALVHVVTGISGGSGASKNPYYTGTIDLEVTGTVNNYTYVDDKETLEVNLDYDSSIGTPPSDTRWHNYIGNHAIINVNGTIYETMKDNNGNIVYYITTNGWQSFTTTNKVYLVLDSVNKVLTLDIYSIKYDNAQMIQNGHVILTGYPMSGAQIIVPLPVDISNLSGTAMALYLPAGMQIKVTWNLKRTF